MSLIQLKSINNKKGETHRKNCLSGYVELVHLDDNNMLLCDEDGLLKHKPINTLATIQAKRLGWKGICCLVGSVLFLKDKEF